MSLTSGQRDFHHHKWVLVSIVHVIHFIDRTGHFAEIAGPLVNEEELAVSTAPTCTMVWLGHEARNAKWVGFLWDLLDLHPKFSTVFCCGVILTEWHDILNLKIRYGRHFHEQTPQLFVSLLGPRQVYSIPKQWWHKIRSSLGETDIIAGTIATMIHQFPH